MRVVVSGGGTGGHIMPALAVAESLQKLRPDAEILYIGAVTGMETEIVPRCGIAFKAVTARKLRKTVSLSTVGVAFSLMRGYAEARAILREFGAQAVVGTGGYVAAATVLAASHLGLPTFIHEGNVLAGRTNLWLARRASRIGVTFADTVKQFPAHKTVVTGLPLREGIVAPETISPSEARGYFAGLEADRFTVLVTGGSQGAQAVNRVVFEAARELLDAGMQLIHHVGAKNFDAANEEAKQRGLLERGGYVPVAFLNDVQMPLAWRACDAVVCRGGISTLSEALVNARPALIVPLPSAYADHQTHNARALESGGAGLLLPENTLTGAGLRDALHRLRNDAKAYQSMVSACRVMARPDAANRVAQETYRMLAANA